MGFVDNLGSFLADDLSILQFLVPVLKVGSFTPEEDINLADGKSLVTGADHIREGIVIKPTIESRVPGFGRLQLKVVSNEFLNQT